MARAFGATPGAAMVPPSSIDYCLFSRKLVDAESLYGLIMAQAVFTGIVDNKNCDVWAYIKRLKFMMKYIFLNTLFDLKARDFRQCLLLCITLSMRVIMHGT